MEAEASRNDGDLVPDLESVTFVLLKRPRNAPEYSEERLAEIQAEHLRYMNSLRERGLLITNGPFEDQPDKTLRGVCLYRVDVEEARRLAAEDPAVIAGRLEVDCFTWLYPRGSLVFPR